MQATLSFHESDRAPKQVGDNIDAVIARIIEPSYASNGPLASNVLLDSPPDSNVQLDTDPEAMNLEEATPEEDCSSQLSVHSELALTSKRAYNVVIRHQRLHLNSVEILKRSEVIPRKSMIDIPFCRMVSLQVVQPAHRLTLTR